MSIIKENEMYLLDYLKEIEELDKELIDLIFPLLKISDDFILNFKNILLEEIPEFEYENMGIKETIDLVREFLSKFDKEYLDLFDKSLVDGTFNFFRVDNLESEEAICNEQGKFVDISIPLRNNIQDGGVIIHEFFHYTNSKYRDKGSRYLLTELISIYMEFRYYQFLVEKGYNQSIFNNSYYERIDNMYDMCVSYYFTGSLLDIYNNTEKISRQNIKFMNNYRKIYKGSICSLIDFIKDENFSEDIFDTFYFASYVVGGIVSLYLLEEPKLNDTKIKYINNKFDVFSIKEILNILNVEINDYQKCIDYESEKLIDIEGELFGKSICYSRPYRSGKN